MRPPPPRKYPRDCCVCGCTIRMRSPGACLPCDCNITICAKCALSSTNGGSICYCPYCQIPTIPPFKCAVYKKHSSDQFSLFPLFKQTRKLKKRRSGCLRARRRYWCFSVYPDKPCVLIEELSGTILRPEYPNCQSILSHLERTSIVVRRRPPPRNRYRQKRKKQLYLRRTCSDRPR